MKSLIFYILGFTLIFQGNLSAQENKKDSSAVAWEKVLKKEAELQSKEIKKDTVHYNLWWADELISFSSEYSKIEKSAKQILGEPNVMPTGGESKMAWAVREKRGEEIKGQGKIVVGLKNVGTVNQILVAESYHPGSIKSITLYGEKEEREIVYSQTPKSIGKDFRMLNIILDKPVSFKIVRLEIITDPHAVEGRNEIDAIGLSDATDTVYWQINHLPKMKFTDPPENLGKNINTAYDEIAPIISPDGKYLYFDRRFYSQNIGGENDKDDIWFSEMQDDSTWSEAVNIGAPLNNEYPNYIQAVTSDGNSVLLANEYLSDGEMSPGVSMSHKTKKGWSFPSIQKIEDFYNQSQYANYFITTDGQYLLMAIEKKDSYGELDIYVSKRINDNKWDIPINLGTQINTLGNDYSPFLAADGHSLYFSSEGHAGYGKADIFVSQRLDDSWQNWTKPENLGPVINTPGMDS